MLSYYNFFRKIKTLVGVWVWHCNLETKHWFYLVINGAM